MKKIFLFCLFLLTLSSGLFYFRPAFAQYNPPQGCSLSLYGCTGGYINCPGTLFCCPNLSYCATATPYISPGLSRPSECNTPAGPGIQTALGCIPTKDSTQFVAWLLGSAIKIAGGVAFLLIIFGAIKILTSAGNPENVRAGRELITSAIMGLLFIIFSLFLLQLIGVKILNIPGFGKPEWSSGGSGPGGGDGGGGGGSQ